MKCSDIRERYLSFFEKRGCKRMPSSSLIPDDPSMLLTSAGMVQFKPYFLQQRQLEPPYQGTTTVQKCVRTTDIDIIGTTGRHLSFFEMLGNFSFGSYFKEEMCAWAYEFSTQELGFDPERIYYTVYLDDDETVEIWKALGVPDSHITRLGEEDNFWTAGPTGPCGPCTELYYDQGPEKGCGSPDCAPGCDCDRFIEYWNLVFTQYDRQEDGSFKPLPKKNIDTGMGLERVAALVQGVQSNFETDILRALIAVGERLSGHSYGQDEKADLSLRIIADHARAITFMIADGVLPGNEGRGYVLRHLIRRAVRHGRVLGIEGPFLGHHVAVVVDQMGTSYPEIVENHELIDRILLSEEERFGMTLRQGQAFLDETLAILDGTVLSGKTAFTLHDTYGFPIELTVEICAERGIEVDQEGFAHEMEMQRDRARAHLKDEAWSTYGGVFNDIFTQFGATTFIGYDYNEGVARVRAIVSGGKRVDSIVSGTEAQIVLDTTPFYGEMGGQVGDTGTIESDDTSTVFEVVDTTIPEKGVHAHRGRLVSGSLSVGDEVHAAIDGMRRERIRRNHTATHILHYALQSILGDHAKQAGSLVAPDHLRFDFMHFEALTGEEIAQIEQYANQKVMENDIVSSYETTLAKAREKGVTALFGEKYGEKVRVLECGTYSKELCGGTHVAHTSEIGFIKITSESSVGANLRRIEAVTSFDALSYMNQIEAELQEAATMLKVPLFDVSERVDALVKRIKGFEDAQKRAKKAAVEGNILDFLDDIVDMGYPLVIARLDGVEAQGLRAAWDVLRARLPRPGAAIIAAKTPEGSPLLLAAGTPEAVGAGFDAGAIIKAIAPAIGGGGGGKPMMAQAGGKNAGGIDDALDRARSFLGIS